MAHKFVEIAFTPGVRAIQVEQGSREAYASMDEGGDYNDRLGAREVTFIADRDSFYMASVGETGWPYVQHRGGAAGFIKVLDERTIGFADYAGNRQFVSTGNFRADDRVALFFMDYPNRRRLKMLGRVQTVGTENAELMARLEDAEYPAQVDRGFVITVEGFDWNCPQHITPRFSEAEVEGRMAALRLENSRLQTAPVASKIPEPTASRRGLADDPGVLGDGPLELVVSGIRQLTSTIRAYELRDPGGYELPVVAAGSHLRLPVRLSSGELVERHYSIASNPQRRDIYEIAVQRETGGGGSSAVHQSYTLGTRVRIDMPANHFGLHSDARPALLIAGGIGITPIKSMAQALEARGAEFHLHYAGRSRTEMAYRDRLQRQLGEQLTVYCSEAGQRLDIAAVLAAAEDAVIYVCGPGRLVGAVMAVARAQSVPRERLRLELFA